MNPLWSPSPAFVNESLMMKFIAFAGLKTADYASLHRYSIEKPEEFWSKFWDFCGILGDKGKTIIERMGDVPYAKFFPDSKINYTENALAQAAKTPNAPAIISRIQNGEDRVI